MFQLIGGLLAFFAIFSAITGAPVAGAVFALSTFIWVIVANPNRRERRVKDVTPRGIVYEVRFSR